MGTGMGYTQTLEVRAFALNGKKIFLAKLPVVDDLNPPINTLRTISEINRQNRLGLHLISPEAAHGLANTRKGNYESRDFFCGCGAFPSSALVCHNGLGEPLADKITTGKESQAVLGALLSPVISMATRGFRGKPMVLVALGVRAQDFRKTGYLEFRLDIGAGRMVAIDVGKGATTGDFCQKYGALAGFFSAIFKQARAHADPFAEKVPYIGFAYFFGGSANAPEGGIGLERAHRRQSIIVEVPEKQAKPALEISYSLEFMTTPECLVALRRGRAP